MRRIVLSVNSRLGNRDKIGEWLIETARSGALPHYPWAPIPSRPVQSRLIPGPAGWMARVCTRDLCRNIFFDLLHRTHSPSITWHFLFFFFFKGSPAGQD